MSTTLLRRAEEKRALYQLIQEAGGEIGPILDQWESEITTNLKEKADNCNSLIESIELEESYFREKSKQCSEVARTLANARERLKDRIKYVMISTGVNEIEGNEIRFKLSNTKPALVLDEATLPVSWKMEIITIEPDKERIRAALEQGEFIPGATLKESHALRVYINKRSIK